MYLSGLILLIMGMGTTLVFLYIMILCTNLNSKIAPKFKNLVPEPEPKKAKPATAAKPAAAADDDAIVAAIAVAMLKAQN